MNELELKPQMEKANTSALERAEQRDLALQATNAVSEVFERDVTIPNLIKVAEAEEASPARLVARRALRCIGTIAHGKADVVSRLGDKDMYHYAEGVINYGASNKRYYELMEKYNLTAEEATGIYALRELIAEQTNGLRPGLQGIVDALGMVGISIEQAALDPEAALAAFDEAGFVVDHVTYQVGDKTVTKQFGTAIFYTTKGNAPSRLLEDDVDGSLTESIADGFRESLRYPPEENEDEAWQRTAVSDYLKNLDS